MLTESNLGIGFKRRQSADRNREGDALDTCRVCDSGVPQDAAPGHLAPIAGSALYCTITFTVCLPDVAPGYDLARGRGKVWSELARLGKVRFALPASSNTMPKRFPQAAL